MFTPEAKYDDRIVTEDNMVTVNEHNASFRKFIYIFHLCRGVQIWLQTENQLPGIPGSVLRASLVE
jgi:hypothetical protein